MVNGSVLLSKNMPSFFRDESAVGVLLSETVNVGMIQKRRGGLSSGSDVFAIGASGRDDWVCRGVVCGWTCGASSCAQETLTGSHARTIQWKSRKRIGLNTPLHAGRDSVPSQRARSHPEVTNVTAKVSSGLESVNVLDCHLHLPDCRPCAACGANYRICFHDGARSFEMLQQFQRRRLCESNTTF